MPLNSYHDLGTIMATVDSTMMELGTKAPGFSLKSTEGKVTHLRDFEGANALVVLFICNHCPYVIHIAPKLAEIASQYRQKGVEFVAINSNDTEAYPADNFDNMVLEKARRKYTFPYLLDETQQVARAYDAVCTPDLFVFDDQQSLVYRGQFDTTRPHRISSGNYDASNGEATGLDLTHALDAILTRQPVAEQQYASIGCSIKWKAENELA